ncbi:MAG TPA: hypothetical protein VK658_03625 [Chryseolinea sp.]|nr:hypothetical protein [Chryseolinea sp.]
MNLPTKSLSLLKGVTDKALEELRQQMNDDYEYAYETGKQELLSYFTRSFKESDLIIEENVTFFQGLRYD